MELQTKRPIPLETDSIVSGSFAFTPFNNTTAINKRLRFLEAAGFDPQSPTVQATVMMKYNEPISIANRVNCFLTEKIRTAAYEKMFKDNLIGIKPIY